MWYEKVVPYRSFTSPTCTPFGTCNYMLHVYKVRAGFYAWETNCNAFRRIALLRNANSNCTHQLSINLGNCNYNFDSNVFKNMKKTLFIKHFPDNFQMFGKKMHSYLVIIAHILRLRGVFDCNLNLLLKCTHNNQCCELRPRTFSQHFTTCWDDDRSSCEPSSCDHVLTASPNKHKRQLFCFRTFKLIVYPTIV